MVTRVSGLVAALMHVLLFLPGAASGQVTYTYHSHVISGWMTMAQPLPPNASPQYITPRSFSFTGGNATVTNGTTIPGSPPLPWFYVALTDASGNPVSWSFALGEYGVTGDFYGIFSTSSPWGFFPPPSCGAAALGIPGTVPVTDVTDHYPPGHVPPYTNGPACDSYSATNTPGTWTRAELIDPVPLLLGSLSTGDLPGLASGGGVVQGVAADGVTEIIVRIPAANSGDQFTLTVVNDQNLPSNSADEDGALGYPGSPSFFPSIPVTAVSTPQGPMAFAVYRAPIDFPRASGQDAGAATRSVSIQVQSLVSNTTTSIPVAILRPPVILVHGIWADKTTTWNNFSPLVSDPLSRFYVEMVDYSRLVGPIQASVPAFDTKVTQNVKANALGFDYNAGDVLAQIQKFIGMFRNGSNPAGIQVGAVQADIVAHSMGGNIARTLPLQPTFFGAVTFGQGNLHKVVTINTPHLGTPVARDLLLETTQPNNNCVRNMIASQGMLAFSTVTINGKTSSGAAGDLRGDGFGGDMSPALQALQQAGPRTIPTAMVAGVVGSGNLNSLSTAQNAIALRFFCYDVPSSAHTPFSPLAMKLTAQGWPTEFNQPSDAIVPLQSQINNLSACNGCLFFGYVHSDGTFNLGFCAPSVLDDTPRPPCPPLPQGSVRVPDQVINLLNTPVTDPTFNRLTP
jgi:hypothetical protein